MLCTCAVCMCCGAVCVCCVMGAVCVVVLYACVVLWVLSVLWCCLCCGAVCVVVLCACDVCVLCRCECGYCVMHGCAMLWVLYSFLLESSNHAAVAVWRSSTNIHSSETRRRVLGWCCCSRKRIWQLHRDSVWWRIQWAARWSIVTSSQLFSSILLTRSITHNHSHSHSPTRSHSLSLSLTSLRTHSHLLSLSIMHTTLILILILALTHSLSHIRPHHTHLQRVRHLAPCAGVAVGWAWGGQEVICCSIVQPP